MKLSDKSHPTWKEAAAVIGRQGVEKSLQKYSNILTDREKQIISMRFGLDDGLPKTLEYIGLKFNLTRERIRQIQEKALERLQKEILDNALREAIKK